MMDTLTTTTKGNLQRAQIFEVDEAGEQKKPGIVVNCHFNPYEYTVSKSNSYTEKAKNKGDTPQVTFAKAGSQTLKLSLIFDTYEEGKDVSRITSDLWKLMETKTRGKGKKAEKIPPPEVAFHWGVFHFGSHYRYDPKVYHVHQRWHSCTGQGGCDLYPAQRSQ
jgi:hypothetical protein